MSWKSFLLLQRPLLLLEKRNVVEIAEMLPGASFLGALGFGLAVVNPVAQISAAATGFMSI